MKHVEEWSIRITGLISMIVTFVAGCVLVYKVGETVLNWVCKATLTVARWFMDILKEKGFDVEKE